MISGLNFYTNYACSIADKQITPINWQNIEIIQYNSFTCSIIYVTALLEYFHLAARFYVHLYFPAAEIIDLYV